MIRQLAEAVLLLALAVILFRGFVAEGYMISTGSMAPCLLGYHRQIICPECAFAFSRGTRYDLEDTILAEGGGTADFAAPARQATVCPNCGLQDIDVSRVPRNEGDQLLVQKHFFQLREPRRWEVVVFRHPQDPKQAYVKRVVGLPLEQVELVEGDVVVDGVLQRKPLSVQRSMRIGVYDNDFAPSGSTWRPRWRPRGAGSRWAEDGTSFVCSGGPQEESAADEVHWLVYGHWIRSGGHHQTSVPLDAWPSAQFSPSSLAPGLEYDAGSRRLTCTGVLESEVAETLLTLSDEAEFRAAVQQLAEQSHVGVITDVYGYNHPYAAEKPFAVHDLMVEATVSALTASGEFRIRMFEGWHWFEAVFDFDRQEVQLLVDGGNSPLRTAALPAALGAASAVIEMSLFDRQVLLAVDGQPVFAPLRYSAQQHPRSSLRQPVELGAARGDFRVEQLHLYRDVYYTPKSIFEHGERTRVGPGELFVLGDNSPVSVDSRSWESATIPEKLLIGKPFVVHLPSQQERFQIGGHVHHIRIPDLSKVRYIR